MFLIGEFSRLGRVSRRQLRHYDELGLLTPTEVDPVTGYRSYHADQLPRLHRILALKDLGFSLDEVRRLVDEDVPAAQLQGMLQLRRAQAEQALEREAARLREIEARIAAIAAPRPLDEVVVRSLDAAHLWSHRFLCRGPEHAFEVMGRLGSGLAGAYGPQRAARPIAIAHGDGFLATDLDLEVGFLVPDDDAVPDTVAGLAMQARTLPAVTRAAISVRRGDPRGDHDAFGAIARWLDVHDHRIAGPIRERFVHFPADPARFDDTVTEIQAPVQPD